MQDGLTYLALVLGFAFVLVAGATLGAGSTSLFGGLFPPQVTRDWPVGVQEPDVPRFVVDHVETLRPAATPPFAGEIEPPQLVDLYERPLAPKTRLNRPA